MPRKDAASVHFKNQLWINSFPTLFVPLLPSKHLESSTYSPASSYSPLNILPLNVSWSVHCEVGNGHILLNHSLTCQTVCYCRAEEQSGHMSQVSVARCVQWLCNNRFCRMCAARFCWLRGACLPILVCRKSFGSEVHQLVTCFTYLCDFSVFGLGRLRHAQRSDASQIHTNMSSPDRNIVRIPGEATCSPTTL